MNQLDGALAAQPGRQTGQQAIEAVVEALGEVMEPEIGVNVVDLGLLYDVRIEEEDLIDIDMTLTSPACPDADVLRDTVYRALERLDVDRQIRVNWVFKPMWGPERVTPEGMEQLRSLGYPV